MRRFVLTIEDLLSAVHNEETPALLAGNDELAACAQASRAGLKDGVGGDEARRVGVFVDDCIAVLRSTCEGSKHLAPDLNPRYLVYFTCHP